MNSVTLAYLTADEQGTLRKLKEAVEITGFYRWNCCGDEPHPHCRYAVEDEKMKAALTRFEAAMDVKYAAM